MQIARITQIYFNASNFTLIVSQKNKKILSFQFNPLNFKFILFKFLFNFIIKIFFSYMKIFL